jgi:Rrf2 family nitric oxide-sensitive transcriptional repressor
VRLTVHSDYALRVLTYVAVAPRRTATVHEVAETFRISHHLVKVAHRLVKAGILEATRGRGGGLRLKLDPNDITVGDIIRASEDDFAVVECLGQTRYCRIAGVCKFRELFRRALAAFFSVLDELTLADAVRNPDALRGALDLTSALRTTKKEAQGSESSRGEAPVLKNHSARLRVW